MIRFLLFVGVGVGVDLGLWGEIEFSSMEVEFMCRSRCSDFKFLGMV